MVVCRDDPDTVVSDFPQHERDGAPDGWGERALIARIRRSRSWLFKVRVPCVTEVCSSRIRTAALHRFGHDEMPTEACYPAASGAERSRSTVH